MAKDLSLITEKKVSDQYFLGKGTYLAHAIYNPVGYTLTEAVGLSNSNQ